MRGTLQGKTKLYADVLTEHPDPLPPQVVLTGKNASMAEIA